MLKPILYYSDHYGITLPREHKFPIPKYRKLRDELSLDDSFHFEPSPLAPVEDVLLAHDAEYVQRFLDGSLSAAEMRRIGFPWSQGLVERSLGSVGGTLAATEQAFLHRWGGTLAGGTHHAFRAEGSGFCVFNDVAVAINKLRHTERIKRAAVVDLDVHQGDGTAQIFTGDDDVFTLSMHGKHNFPFRKQQSWLDVELPDGTTDEAYLAELDAALPQVMAFHPDIIFFQSGVDALATDALGRLALTPAGILERDRRVITVAQKYQLPLVITLGGGYSKPIELTVAAHASTYRLAATMYQKQE